MKYKILQEIVAYNVDNIDSFLSFDIAVLAFSIFLFFKQKHCSD